MIRQEPQLPEFLREAFEAESDRKPATLDGMPLDAGRLGAAGRERAERDVLEALEALPQGFAPVAALGRDRLLAAVEVLPLRYAPFFDRLAVLWDMQGTEVIAVLERAAQANAWRKPGLPGLRLIDVAAGPRLLGARVTLARFAAGMRFPTHRHHGPETLLVLEGSYRDQSGLLVGPGDMHEMNAHSEHFFKVTPGAACVAASVQFGMEFTGPVMRILTRLFG
jgi:quercetin dioxygenase-like cupin family protein